MDIYKDLPLIKNQRLKLTSADPFTPTYVKNGLTQASDPAGVYAARIQSRQIGLENPARESRAKKQREEKRHKQRAAKERKASGVISKKEAKAKGTWQFDKTQAKFDLFIPLHQLWLGYMSELLCLASACSKLPTLQDIPGAAGMHPKLLKADFHGSIMTVSQSKNPDLVGASGIVILESENAFRVITRKNQVKLLPKANSIFTFAVPLYSTLAASTSTAPVQESSSLQTVLDSPHISFELYGNQFRFRSADRAGRKFKHKETIEL